jgi:hypothetical protein
VVLAGVQVIHHEERAERTHGGNERERCAAQADHERADQQLQA